MLDSNTVSSGILVHLLVGVFAPDPRVWKVWMLLELAVSVCAALTSLGVANLRLGECAALLASKYGHSANLTSPNALSCAASLGALRPSTPFLRHDAIHGAGVRVAETA